MEQVAAFRGWIQPRMTFVIGAILVVVLVGNLLYEPFAGYATATVPFLHWIGIVGGVLSVLSLSYSLKKRTPLLKAGRIKTWLDWHAILGFAGPVLVELHSGPHWDGVGGMARIVMWLVVLSGIVGKYLYNVIPTAMAENVDAAAALADEKRVLEQDIAVLQQRRLQVARDVQEVGLTPMLAGRRPPRVSAGVFSSWAVFRDMVRFNYFYFKDLAASQRQIDAHYREERASIRELYGRLFQRIDLERRLALLMVGDEAVRVWRLIHIPLCLLLAVLTGVHIWTVLYY